MNMQSLVVITLSLISITACGMQPEEHARPPLVQHTGDGMWDISDLRFHMEGRTACQALQKAIEGINPEGFSSFRIKIVPGLGTEHITAHDIPGLYRTLRETARARLGEGEIWSFESQASNYSHIITYVKTNRLKKDVPSS